MNREIIIYCGDEHRAKIERQFYKNDVFGDVYEKAAQILEDVESDMERYRKEIEANKNKNCTAGYQGMGDNRIVFCGGRGQGKTSAMKSFVQCLAGMYREERKGDERERLAFLSKIGFAKYEVVDSIDPSAMENEETILRVLISRLFFGLEKYVKSDECHEKDKADFIQNRKEILKLFETCYANIECIKSGKASDYEQDDLQHLSEMGSSARLKANLYELIGKYLTMTAGGNDGVGGRYLIVPIDDADLMTKKLFDMCEDIRNYLSIPNVIILMAVDYEQLIYVIYQKYLKQYKVMRKAREGSHYCEKCHKMAAKYLEKVFPVIHRIDLPQLDSLIADTAENVTFEYQKYEKKKEEWVSVFPDINFKQCHNLHEQLMRIVYSRTGMIFMPQEQDVHLFMPHTFRELTQWLKMLHSMNELDCDREVYRQFQEAQETDDGVKTVEHLAVHLIENIRILKQYFLSYWCEKHLDIDVSWEFQRLDSAFIKYAEKPEECDMDGLTAAMEKVYGEIKRSLDGQCGHDRYFYQAVSIYTTIFLNEWFAMALLNPVQFKKIAAFVEEVMDLTYRGDEKDIREGYGKLRFCLNPQILKDVTDNNKETAQKYIGYFCVTLQVRNPDTDEKAIFGYGDSKNWESEKTLEFDIFRPILVNLNSYAGDDAVTETDASLGKDTVTDSGVTERPERIRASRLIVIRNVLANCDVQRQMKSVTDVWCKNLYEKSESDATGSVYLTEQFFNLLTMLQECLTAFQTDSDDKILDIFNDQNLLDSEMMDTMCLCNYSHFNVYMGQRNAELEECLTSAENTKKTIREDIDSKNDEKITGARNSGENLIRLIEKKLNENGIPWEQMKKISEAFDICDLYKKIIEQKDSLDGVKRELEKSMQKPSAVLANVNKDKTAELPKKE